MTMFNKIQISFLSNSTGVRAPAVQPKEPRPVARRRVTRHRPSCPPSQEQRLRRGGSGQRQDATSSSCRLRAALWGGGGGGCGENKVGQVRSEFLKGIL